MCSPESPSIKRCLFWVKKILLYSSKRWLFSRETTIVCLQKNHRFKCKRAISESRTHRSAVQRLKFRGTTSTISKLLPPAKRAFGWRQKTFWLGPKVSASIVLYRRTMRSAPQECVSGTLFLYLVSALEKHFQIVVGFLQVHVFIKKYSHGVFVPHAEALSRAENSPSLYQRSSYQ